MMNIIKTAIVTIIISVISGLMLEYFKNIAPKILCNIGDGTPIKINNKRVYAYIITVSNLSNKIIHDLALNIQSHYNNLQIADAKITRGLKFEASIKNNILDIDIPFLSKGDKFTTTVYVENQYEAYIKPVIVMRSPENFKEVSSIEQNGILSSLSDLLKNINHSVSKKMKGTKITVHNKKDDFTIAMNKVSDHERAMDTTSKKSLHRNERITKSKQATLIILSVILAAIVGVLVKSYFKGNSTYTTTPVLNTNNDTQPTSTTESTKETAKNSSSKAQTSGTAKGSYTNTPTKGTTKNSDTKNSSKAATENSNTKTPTVTTTNNSVSKTPTATAANNPVTITPTAAPTNNSGSNTTSGTTTNNSGAKTPTTTPVSSSVSATPSATPTNSSGSIAPTGQTAGNTGSPTPTAGTTVK